MGETILDLDKIVPDKRIVKLAGKEIDVSKVPSRAVFEIEKNKKKLQSGGDETFDLLLKIACDICRPSFKDITPDWLIDNTDFDQLQALLEFVMQPIREKAEKTKEKNEGSPGQ